jgi:hypothetical protein
MQLLEPGKHTWLLKTLYGLLMLLPQVCSNVIPRVNIEINTQWTLLLLLSEGYISLYLEHTCC